MKHMKKILFFAVIIIIFSIIVFNIYRKVEISGRGMRPNVFAVGVQVLKKETVDIAYEFSGILEGDPQVKVYSDVTGKFIRNAAGEGGYVKKGDVIAYIDRDIVGQEFQHAIVRSPVHGMVKKLYFRDRGAAVSTSLPVAEIANTENIKAVVSVGQEYLSKLRKGMTVRISPTFDRSRFIDSTISSVTPFVDSDTLTGAFEVKAGNTANLIIGSSVTVNVVTGRISAFMAPQGAVNMGIDDVYVFVNDNGKARKVAVTQGYVSNELIEIKGGLKEGEELITEGSFKLSDGSSVSTVGREPGKAKKERK